MFSDIVVNPSSVSTCPLLIRITGLLLFVSSTNGFADPFAPVNLIDCPCLPSNCMSPNADFNGLIVACSVNSPSLSISPSPSSYPTPYRASTPSGTRSSKSSSQSKQTITKMIK